MKKCGLGPQNGLESSGTEKLLKIVSFQKTILSQLDKVSGHIDPLGSPFLNFFDFTCRPSLYKCISESHEFVVLPCTLDLLSLFVVELEPNRWHLFICDLLGGFPCVQ
jgi:hypothetical protein